MKGTVDKVKKGKDGIVTLTLSYEYKFVFLMYSWKRPRFLFWRFDGWSIRWNRNYASNNRPWVWCDTEEKAMRVAARYLKTGVIPQVYEGVSFEQKILDRIAIECEIMDACDA